MYMVNTWLTYDGGKKGSSPTAPIGSGNYEREHGTSLNKKPDTRNKPKTPSLNEIEKWPSYQRTEKQDLDEAYNSIRSTKNGDAKVKQLQEIMEKEIGSDIAESVCKLYTRDPDLFNAAMQRVEDIYCRNLGPMIDGMYDPDYEIVHISSENYQTPEHDIVHELGHAYIYRLSESKDHQKIDKNFNKNIDEFFRSNKLETQDQKLNFLGNISGYAKTSYMRDKPQEVFCEALADVIVNGNKASKESKNLYAFIRNEDSKKANYSELIK